MIALGDVSTVFGPLFEMGELDSEDSSLDCVHAVVETGDLRVMDRSSSPVAKHSNTLCGFLVACYYSSAFTQGPEILSGVEAECSEVSD